MRWSPESVAAATAGRLRNGDPYAELAGVGTDSRSQVPGTLFVALREARDGHDFVDAAVAAGAGAVMVEAGWPGSAAVAVIEVADTVEGLLALGRAARDRLAHDVVVIGITGSVGKTSTKDLAYSALSAGLRTTASQRSFNNEIGVPVTLANAPEDIQAAVIEMGARRIGQISVLCRVARPTIGVVTAVAPAHTEDFGSLEAVVVAKGELVEALPPDGIAVLNADDTRVASMAARTSACVLRYSAAGSADADVVASAVTVDDQLHPRFDVVSPWGRMELRLEARGAHQVGNALAALAVAGACGVDLEAAGGALADATLSPWRMEVHRTASGATVVNDAYNANPVSMAAALEALASLPAVRRVAVLGEMAELGDRSAAEHREVADLASRLGIAVIAIGTSAYGLSPAGDIEAAIAALGKLGSEDAVLVKASRVVGLERLAQAISDAAAGRATPGSR